MRFSVKHQEPDIPVFSLCLVYRCPSRFPMADDHFCAFFHSLIHRLFHGCPALILRYVITGLFSGCFSICLHCLPDGLINSQVVDTFPVGDNCDRYRRLFFLSAASKSEKHSRCKTQANRLFLHIYIPLIDPSLFFCIHPVHRLSYPSIRPAD